MKKALELKYPFLFYLEDGKIINGPNPNMTGDYSGLSGNCTGLRGDLSGLRGDLSGLWGDCSGLRGNCTGLIGNCTGISGNIDECEISDQERECGVNINDLTDKKTIK